MLEVFLITLAIVAAIYFAPLIFGLLIAFVAVVGGLIGLGIVAVIDWVSSWW
jgi:hypothetical protein